ncbi:PIN domain-containing protein [Marinitoga litoralis]|uniref:PIN domain-containing protein n=1 Tax=Marinitoga litoralis TaxID=570855 RepID=UPI001961DC71|nr:PIN domain-containing protein [Marinitoga litoralis]MBM7560018.1 rRNA-processing protein FCF1 [Marinitoga litoralis]
MKYDEIFENLFDIEEKEENNLKIEVYLKNKIVLSKELKYDEIIIGRSVESDVDISEFDSEKSFSRKILRILRVEGKYYVEDISNNEVILNKKVMEKDKRYEIRNGDKMIINRKIGIKFITNNEEIIPNEITITNKKIILDTNVLINDVEIIDKLISQKNKIIIPYEILEELDNLKRKKDLQSNINKIHKKLEKYSEKKIVDFRLSDISNLPPELKTSKADNIILSVAIKEKDCIFLTSDKNLKLKARGLGIDVRDLNEI